MHRCVVKQYVNWKGTSKILLRRVHYGATQGAAQQDTGGGCRSAGHRGRFMWRTHCGATQCATRPQRKVERGHAKHAQPHEAVMSSMHRSGVMQQMQSRAACTA
eukprot:364543-Chlamydomonas_euryale.AAC.4